MPTLTISTSMSFAPGVGSSDTAGQASLSFSLTYTRKFDLECHFDGASADQVVFDASADPGMANAKALLVQSSSGGGTIAINAAASQEIPIKADNGHLLYTNEDGGISKVEVTTTTAADFKITVFA